jgi:tetraacyldisaccharide 4'-kinase
MGRRLEQLEEFGIDVVLERRHGVRASVLRGILYALSFVYDRLVQLRLYFYRKRVFRERTLGCLVISIGNLTVGGTGKTPIVEKFARALQAGGRRVAILSRGYKSVPRKTRLAEPVPWRFRASTNRFRWKIPAARFANRRG